MTWPDLYRWAIANPFTRWLTQRRTKQIFDLMSGFVHSLVLLFCVKLDLFVMLRQQPAKLDELAARCRLPAAVLQRLVLSAVALRLLEHRSRQRFGLGPLEMLMAAHTSSLSDLTRKRQMDRQKRRFLSKVIDFWPSLGLFFAITLL